MERFEEAVPLKNTVRFQEEANGKPSVIGTLYVQRWALGEPLPQSLVVGHSLRVRA